MLLERSKRRVSKLSSSENGFASLVIALVLILVVALISVGFAQLARHEQQQSLSSQLATAAYYAAESGVNDISQVLGDPTSVSYGKLDTQAKTYKNACIPNAALNDIFSASGAKTSTLNSSLGFSYQCVMVSLNNPELKYTTAVDEGKTVVTTTSAPLSTLNIEWESADGHSSTWAGGGHNFTPTSSWGTHPAVIELSVTPLAGGYDRAAVAGKTFTVYLFPNTANSNTSAAYSTNAADQGAILNGDCGAGSHPGGYECESQIDMSASTGGPYLIHYTSLYDSTNVRIYGSDSSSNPVDFSGGQASIDVTGKARNVLKRIKVYVPVGSSNQLANYAIEAKNICKRIATQKNDTSFYDTTPSIVTTGPCVPVDPTAIGP